MNYFDSVSNFIYLHDTTIYKSGAPALMALFKDDKIIFTFWLIGGYKTISCNWVVGRYNREKHAVEIELGRPNHLFKYDSVPNAKSKFILQQCTTNSVSE